MNYNKLVILCILFFSSGLLGEGLKSSNAKEKVDAFIQGSDDAVHAKGFFDDIVHAFHSNFHNDLDIIIVAHVVPTLLPYIEALEKIGNLAFIVPKSSFSNEHTKAKVADKLLPEVLKLNQDEKRNWFKNPQNVIQTISSRITRNKFLIVDIGGYFSYAQKELKHHFGHRFLGVVEDTENGQQKYEANLSDVSVISVARSPLKETEDYNVGKSIVEATDAILRNSAHTMLPRFKTVGVLGFGKIGQSIATHLREKGIRRIIVYDRDPENKSLFRSMKASSLGFEVVEKEVLLKESEFIFAATGRGGLSQDELSFLADHIFISSCTSSDDEFKGDFFATLDLHHISGKITQYYNSTTGRFINLLNNGNAVNFVFDAVNGPYIYSVMGSLIAAMKPLVEGRVRASSELGEVAVFGVQNNKPSRETIRIAEIWLKHFEHVW